MFSENFKKYRKLSGMTQEEVAKFLMVTPQAVSKWETGNGTPDISLLVPIAELFDIPTDALLGRASTIIDATLDEIYNSSEESYKEKYNKCIELLKSNPNNEKILLKLLSLSAELLSHEKELLNITEQEELIINAKDFARRLKKEKTCSASIEAHGRLADVYMAAGDLRQAKEEILKLPESSRYTRKRMLGNLALKENHYKKSREFYRESVNDTITFLLWDIERIAQSYHAMLSDDFKINRAKMDEIYKIEYDIIHAIGAECSPLLKIRLCNAAIRLAQKAVWSGDHKKAFEYLDEFIYNACALHNNTIQADTAHSPILPSQPHTVINLTKKSILYRLSWNAFNPIRTDPRFQSYVKKIESWS